MCGEEGEGLKVSKHGMVLEREEGDTVFRLKGFGILLVSREGYSQRGLECQVECVVRTC